MTSCPSERHVLCPFNSWREDTAWMIGLSCPLSTSCFGNNGYWPCKAEASAPIYGDVPLVVAQFVVDEPPFCLFRRGSKGCVERVVGQTDRS